MTETVDVSVVIPVRDGERYLAAALDSVLEQDPHRARSSWSTTAPSTGPRR